MPCARRAEVITSDVQHGDRARIQIVTVPISCAIVQKRRSGHIQFNSLSIRGENAVLISFKSASHDLEPTALKPNSGAIAIADARAEKANILNGHVSTLD